MSNELAISNQMSLSDLGTILAKSGFFSDTRDAAQAVVKVLAGQELGSGPIASMTGVFVIQNRISISANMIAAAIKRTKKYNFRVTELSDEKCEIAFFEDGKEVGRSLFTKQDAAKAGTKNMDKFPRNMLFARAISNGAKWYCADIFGGPIYTPEELGATVDENGDVVDIPVVEVKQPEKPTADITVDLAHLAGICNRDGTPYILIPADKLPFMKKSLTLVFNNPETSDEDRAAAEKKLDVIKEIETWRANHASHAA